MAKFLIQAAGISWALSDPGILSLYGGFFLYGIGMGGTSILAELIWANYFGRVSLGKIRGMGSLLTSTFSAGGPPFFACCSITPKDISFLSVSSSVYCSPQPCSFSSSARRESKR